MLRPTLLAIALASSVAAESWQIYPQLCENGAVASITPDTTKYPPAGEPAKIVAGDSAATTLFNSIKSQYASIINGVPVKKTVNNDGVTLDTSSYSPSSGDCWWTYDGCRTPNKAGLTDDIFTLPQAKTWGLTIDDGPDCDHDQMYAFLDTKKQLATSFFIGANVLSYPDAAKRVLASGHEIAGHSWSHSAMTTLTDEQVFAEGYYTKKVIKEVLGITITTFRCPYGDVDNRVRAILKGLDLVYISWSADTNDWMSEDEAAKGAKDPLAKSQADYNTIIATGKTATKGDIVLHHETSVYTAQLLIKNYDTILATFGAMVPVTVGRNIAKPYPDSTCAFPSFDQYKAGQRGTCGTIQGGAVASSSSIRSSSTSSVRSSSSVPVARSSSTSSVRSSSSAPVARSSSSSVPVVRSSSSVPVARSSSSAPVAGSSSSVPVVRSSSSTPVARSSSTVPVVNSPSVTPSSSTTSSSSTPSSSAVPGPAPAGKVYSCPAPATVGYTTVVQSTRNGKLICAYSNNKKRLARRQDLVIEAATCEFDEATGALAAGGSGVSCPTVAILVDIIPVVSDSTSSAATASPTAPVDDPATITLEPSTPSASASSSATATDDEPASVTPSTTTSDAFPAPTSAPTPPAFPNRPNRPNPQGPRCTQGPQEIARRYWRHKHHGREHGEEDDDYKGNPVFPPNPVNGGAEYEVAGPDGPELVQVIDAVRPTSPSAPWPVLPSDEAEVCNIDETPECDVSPISAAPAPEAGSNGAVSSGQDGVGAMPALDGSAPAIVGNGTAPVNANGVAPSRPTPLGVGPDTASLGAASRFVAGGLSVVAVVVAAVLVL